LSRSASQTALRTYVVVSHHHRSVDQPGAEESVDRDIDLLRLKAAIGLRDVWRHRMFRSAHCRRCDHFSAEGCASQKIPLDAASQPANRRPLNDAT
jgi:hypothetical protein